MTDDPRTVLRALAEALPDGAAVPVPRAWLLALLDGAETSKAVPPAPDAAAGNVERLLTVEDVAARLGQSPTWVYRHSAEWPFTRRLGRRSLRFDPAGLETWLARRRAA